MKNKELLCENIDIFQIKKIADSKKESYSQIIQEVMSKSFHVLANMNKDSALFEYAIKTLSKIDEIPNESFQFKLNTLIKWHSALIMFDNYRDCYTYKKNCNEDKEIDIKILTLIGIEKLIQNYKNGLFKTSIL